MTESESNQSPHESAREPVRADEGVPERGSELLTVVGLGGSAGCIPVLQRFFSLLPAGSGMAYVVVLHLSPEHDSMLSEILQRSTSMPVTRAVDGEQVLADRVYVIPPGKQITLTDGHLRLTELSRQLGRRTAVDLFFRSLADTHGPRAVAVVLSGADGDGAIGIKRVKELGGLTIAQDPELAEHPSMPRAAIATDMVDWVLRVEEVPQRLLDYQARQKRLQVPPEAGPNPAVAARMPPGVEEAALRDVLTFLRTRTGRDFSYYKRATIVRRIARRMQVNEVDTLPAYLTSLRTRPGEATALLQDLLISVTNFFRDHEAFAALSAAVPGLFSGKSHGDTLRVWVPACATGEEVYSIAMLLVEHAQCLDSPPAIQVFATDLDEGALATARSAFYPPGIATDVSEQRLRKFFEREHDGYRVRHELREIVLFAVHDLLRDSPFSRLDLVSCRNLLIYLNQDAQRRALDVFHFALRPGGRLLLGSSESVDDGSEAFYAVDKKHRLYGARPSVRANLPVPTSPGTLAKTLALRERDEKGATFVALQPPPRPTWPRLPRVSTSDRLSWSELHLKLIERFGYPSLIVNAQHEILHLSQSIAPFLQFSGGEPSSNVMDVVHPALRGKLRAALCRAQQTGETAVVEGIAVPVSDGQCSVDIRVSSMPELSSEFFLIVLKRRKGEGAQPARAAEPDDFLVQHLEREAEQTKRQLRDVIEQHDAATEELKASNEELQAMNEELRAAKEELETSREELQSINEELTTVNQELKNKVDELACSNSDLQNLMGATAIAIVFLDRGLRIMRFTPPAVELFRLIDSDVGRPLSDLQPRLDYPELLRDAQQVLQQLVPVERELVAREGRHFLARLLPYRADDRIGGVVLTFIDITERQQAQLAALSAREELESRVRERTAELDSVNSKLRAEVTSHVLAEKGRQELQRRLLNAQEDERARISRELHDEVGQQISALMLVLKALEDAKPDQDYPGRLRELRALAEGMAREVHQLAFELRPAALDQLGLAGALSAYLEGWTARTGTPVELVIAGLDEARLDNQTETALYRIVQEAMNNVYKHARATQVSVSVERRRDYVMAIIEDDGAGFDASSLRADGAPTRLGTAGMHERANMIGGELVIDSELGRGTTVRVKLPLRAPPA